MSTLSPSAGRTAGITAHGALGAGLAGAVVYGLAMTIGEAFDLNAGDDDAAFQWTELWFYVVSPLVAVAVAWWLARRALAGSPRLLARTALGLAIAAGVTVVVFWTGWPLVLGAVAPLLGLEHRRRLGSFAPTAVAATFVGSLAMVLGAWLCITG